MYDSEQQIIAAFLRADKVEEILELTENDFEHYGSTFKAMKELWMKERCIDIAKLIDMTEQFNTIHEFCDFAGQYIEPNFFPNYKRLKQKSVIRKMRLIGNVENVDENTIDFVSGLKEEMQQLYEKDQKEDPTIGISYYNELERRKQEKVRMRYGIASLDGVTGGIHKKEFTVLAARPGVGKSAFALQVAKNAAKEGLVLFFSLEMSKDSFIERLVCSETEIPHNALKVGVLTNEDMESLHCVMERVPPTLLMFEKKTNLTQIKETIKEYSPELVIIDQVGLMKASGKFNSRREEITEITRTLKLLALEKNIAIIGIAQINRGGAEKIPTLSDLKESGSYEEDADNVILVHKWTSEDAQNYMGISNDRYMKMESYGDRPAALFLAKQRNGMITTVNTIYIGSKFTFADEWKEDKDGRVFAVRKV